MEEEEVSRTVGAAWTQQEERDCDDSKDDTEINCQALVSCRCCTTQGSLRAQEHPRALRLLGGQIWVCDRPARSKGHRLGHGQLGNFPVLVLPRRRSETQLPDTAKDLVGDLLKFPIDGAE